MNKLSENNLLDFIKQMFYELKRVITFAVIMLLVAGPLTVLNDTASAAQVSNRSVNISNAVAGQTGVTYTFTYTPGSAGDIQGMFFQGCTTPVGACTAPAGLNLGGGTLVLTSGFLGSPGSVTQNTSNTTPACNVSSNLCATWADGTPQTTSNPLVITVSGVTNQNSTNCSNAPNCTFFVRMTTYSDQLYASPVDSGNVASSTTQTLTVQSIIQEELTFCVGAVNGNSTTVEVYNSTIPTCGTLAGSSINLGTLSYSDVSVSPVPTTQPTNGDLNNAVLELNTNAYNGTSISYIAIQQSGTHFQGAMRVVGATCSATASFTDQCINSVNPSGTITPGTEAFGMAIPGVNCNQTPTIPGYTCNALSHNLSVTAAYGCAAGDISTVAGGSFSVTDAGGQSSVSALNTANGTNHTSCSYMWDDSGAQNTIASSSAPNGVVPGEALIAEFAATPEVTTPTGSYTAEANYIATPQY